MDHGQRRLSGLLHGIGRVSCRGGTIGDNIVTKDTASSRGGAQVCLGGSNLVEIYEGRVDSSDLLAVSVRRQVGRELQRVMNAKRQYGGFTSIPNA